MDKYIQGCQKTWNFQLKSIKNFEYRKVFKCLVGNVYTFWFDTKNLSNKWENLVIIEILIKNTFK